MNWLTKYAITIPAGIGYALIIWMLLSFVGGAFVGMIAAIFYEGDLEYFDSLTSPIVTTFLVIAILLMIPIDWWISRFLSRETKKVAAIAPANMEISH